MNQFLKNELQALAIVLETIAWLLLAAMFFTLVIDVLTFGEVMF